MPDEPREGHCRLASNARVCFRANFVSALAKRLLGVGQLVGLRHETLALVPPGQEVSWEDVRRRCWPGGDPVGVTLEVPVWVPARAQRLKTYSGFEKKWQTVALNTPRPSGCVWFVRTLAEINDKNRYRPATKRRSRNRTRPSSPS